MTVEQALARAVALAEDGVGSTSPNPSVGCVVLSADGEVVGEGRTQPPADGVVVTGGGRHAEVVALAAAGERARGGTAVVTLEPCSHAGRSPACTDALLAAGVARVVHAVRDPDPSAAGGADALAGAGVRVVGPDDLPPEATAAARRGLEAWLVSVRRGRPHVHVKLATSLDGRVAAADGTSQWITSPEARAQGRALRGHCDAVLVGLGTVLADDPALTVRDAAGVARGHQPWRVVLDSRGRTPPGSQVLDGTVRTVLATREDVPARLLPPAVDHVGLPVGARGRVDLAALLAELGSRGLRSVLVEGGPTLVGALVDARLVDRVTLWTAPLLLGGGGLAAVGGRGAGTLAAGLTLEVDDVGRAGPDVRVSARVRDAEGDDRAPAGRCTS